MWEVWVYVRMYTQLVYVKPCTYSKNLSTYQHLTEPLGMGYICATINPQSETSKYINLFAGVKRNKQPRLCVHWTLNIVCPEIYDSYSMDWLFAFRILSIEQSNHFSSFPSNFQSSRIKRSWQSMHVNDSHSYSWNSTSSIVLNPT